MIVQRLFRHLQVTILATSILLVVIMFLNVLTGYHALGFTGLWYELDLKIEGNFATWVESVMMLLCAIPMYALFLKASDAGWSMPSRLLFLLLTVVAIFFSADEMLSIHEQIQARSAVVSGLVAGTFLDGFGWVAVYAPMLLAGAVLAFLAARDILALSDTGTRRQLLRLLVTIIGAAVLILLFEVLEAYLYSRNISREISTIFEESMELVVINGFFGLGIRILQVADTAGSRKVPADGPGA